MKPKKPSAKKPNRDSRDSKPKERRFYALLHKRTGEFGTDAFGGFYLFESRSAAQQFSRQLFSMRGVTYSGTFSVVRVRLTLEVLP